MRLSTTLRLFAMIGALLIAPFRAVGDAATEAFAFVLDTVLADRIPNMSQSLTLDAIGHQAMIEDAALSRRPFLAFVLDKLKHARYSAGRFVHGETPAVC